MSINQQQLYSAMLQTNQSTCRHKPQKISQRSGKNKSVKYKISEWWSKTSSQNILELQSHILGDYLAAMMSFHIVCTTNRVDTWHTVLELRLSILRFSSACCNKTTTPYIYIYYTLSIYFMITSSKW